MSHLIPWQIQAAQVTLSGGNYFDGALAVTNAIGASVSDDVQVKLFHQDCATEDTSDAGVVTIDVTDATPASFGYSVNINQSLIGDDADYSSCDANANADCAEGTIDFCTRVSTFSGSTEVFFRETIFQLAYNLTDNDISLDNVVITENTVDSFLTDVDTAFIVESCQCDANNDCITTPPDVEQDTSLVMCIYPEHESDDSLNDIVKITNFDLTISGGSVSYNPVAFGTSTWNPDTLTSVVPDTEENVIKITTPITAQFFIQDVQTVSVGGNAFLEFTSAKGGAPMFGAYTLNIGLVAGPEGGCLQGLVARFRALF